MCLVSVIMPAFNAEDTICDSISSVLNQTYRDWELIIINDGSTDGTLKTLEKFKNNKKIIVITQKNQGVANARNTGILNSSGKYIAFLDSDDLWLESKLEKQIGMAKKNSAALVYCDIYCFKGNSRYAYTCDNREFIKFQDDKERILTHDFINASSVLVKRSTLDDVGLFSSEFFGTEDWDMWIRISKKYVFHKISGRHVLYRVHAKGISKNILSHSENEMKIIKKHVINPQLINARVRHYSLVFYFAKKIMYLVLNYDKRVFAEIYKVSNLKKLSITIYYLVYKIIRKLIFMKKIPMSNLIKIHVS